MKSEDLLTVIEPERRGGRRRDALARAPGERARMIRFVIAPDGAVVADVDERLPGRGIWLEADRARLAEAVKKNVFARAAKAPARPAADLPATVEAALRRRCLDLLGLARRAGLVVAGFDQVEAALAKGGVGLVLIAADAASQAQKIRRAAGSVPVVSSLGRAELGRALGRDELVYVAVAASGLAQRLARELDRLEGLRAEGPAGEAASGKETQQGGDDR
ncbi:MAG: RNA-binding protein [Geminicoccaceae bacterium]|nr:RNA-binding protein [Geminicoccaceae bacterium]MDW8369456.1 RNA-binding protein [Geminicoccaceae bacterium]